MRHHACLALLRVRFARVRDELADRPRGKLIKLALFDHRWSGQPLRPPVLVLTWKDWRGEPELLKPSRVSAAPVGPGAPVPMPSVPPTVSPSVPPSSPSVPPGVDPGAAREVPAPRRSTPPVQEAASIVVDPELSSSTRTLDLFGQWTFRPGLSARLAASAGVQPFGPPNGTTRTVLANGDFTSIERRTGPVINLSLDMRL